VGGPLDSREIPARPACVTGTNTAISVFYDRSEAFTPTGAFTMHGSIVFVLALLGLLTFTSTPQASPLAASGGLAAAAAETAMVEQVRHHARHHRHWRHYGWRRGHHYGWRHRHHPHRR